MIDVRTFTVSEDDDGIRLDRWFKRHLPEVSFNLVSRWARTGQLRLAGKRAVPGDRVEAGQEIRVPPQENTAPSRAKPKPSSLTADEEQFVRDMVIFEDANAFECFGICDGRHSAVIRGALQSVTAEPLARTRVAG